MNFIECVHKKHCNTTVYLVLDQAANILLKLLKVLQTSFLVLKCIQFSWTVCLVVLYSYIYFYVLWLLTDCLLISSVPHMTPVWLYWETESEREIWEQRWWAALAGRDAAPRAPRRAALQPRSLVAFQHFPCFVWLTTMDSFLNILPQINFTTTVAFV